MSRAPYAPAPGSVAQRAIAHLESQPPRTELSTAALAEAIGVPVGNLKPCLEAPLKAGILDARQKYEHPRAPFFWSLADRQKTPPKGSNRDASTGQSHGAEGSASPTGRGENVASACGADPVFIRTAPPEQVDHLIGVNATLSLSGELAIVAECGTVMLFDKVRARELLEFFAGRSAA